LLGFAVTRSCATIAALLCFGALAVAQTVPSDATRPPVVLVNGWETGFTNSCPVSSSAATTFGNLPAYLLADGVPVVYFFDNCAQDPNESIEKLGNDFGKFLNNITFDNGQQVPQIDVVAFSMGGLVVRAYLAGLQANGALTPPANPLVRDLVLIATPNFGSFLAANNASSIPAGTQSAEMIPGSSFLWNLATWNQRIDDLHGVNAIAVIGNAGSYISTLTGITLGNAADGVVSLPSASLGFVAQQDGVTRIVPYCHVDPGSFTNPNLGPLNCSGTGIANVANESQLTGRIVRSFLAGTPDWRAIGSTPSTDPYLSMDGGTFFAMVNQTGNYVTDMNLVLWGTLPMVMGGAAGTIFVNDFVSGTGAFMPSSQSLGTINCGSVAQAVGYFAAARCKLATAIISIGPLSGKPGRVIDAGRAITLIGADLGFLCNGCKVTATPPGGNPVSLNVSSWNSQLITAQLPPDLTGLLTISVLSTTGNDSITALVESPPTISVSQTSLQFTADVGGSNPVAQSIDITNAGAGTLAWTASATSATGSWLNVSPSLGIAPSALSIAVNAAGLAAGTYAGTVQIAATGASNSPLSISVTLTVAAAPPTLTVSPQSLNFQYTAGGAVPAAQNILIANAGGGSLAWTASTSDFWLTTAKASGVAPAQLAISVDPANLAAGTYTGSVVISAPGTAGSPAAVAVTLVVEGSQAAGAITGVTNAASFSSGVASATWVAIFGTNLSQSTYTWQPSDIVNGQLPKSLHGVSVTINGFAAYVEYISPTQINVLAPDDATVGSVSVVVTTAGQTSNSFSAQKQNFAPAFFVSGNTSYAAAQHADYSLVNAAHPARPGETIMIYGTGFGPTNPPVPTGQLVTTAEPLANSVQISIGGVNTNASFAGLVEAGLYQFNVAIPAGLASGDAGLTAVISGAQTQTGVSIPVQQ
jgi:uncharacterized protein (TIGR03437 family)